MTLTSEQYDKLLSSYIESIVDGMDMRDLVQFVADTIEENLRKDCSSDVELVKEMQRFYDDDVVADVLESVGANPADFNIQAQPE